MLTVFKYSIPMPLKDRFSLELPKGTEILAVHVQYGRPQLWAMVNPNHPLETRNFLLIDTGQPIEFKGCHGAVSFNYIGTFQLKDGTYVGHIFEFFEANTEKS